jgi:propanol-preferring alcohol dehydrogenase
MGLDEPGGDGLTPIRNRCRHSASTVADPMKSYDVAEFGSPLQLFERPTPKPAGTEVLLRVRAAGVCHTDLHIWDGHYDLGGGKRLNLTDRGVRLPLTLGHETVGEVLELGPEAHGVNPNDRVLVFPWIGCGNCAVCKRGEEQLCLAPRCLGIYRAGGYGDHILVPHPRYLLDIGDLSPVQAAPYACSGLTAYGALKKIGALLAEMPILIIGAGGLGLMCLTLLGAMGAKGALVADIDANKRDAALAAGALDLVRRKRIPPIPIRERPLHEAAAALADLQANRLIGRCVLIP